MNFKIEGIIYNSIFTERNETNRNNYVTNIAKNLDGLDFNNKIENYIPCGRSLYVTRPRMRVLLYNSIILNDNICLKGNQPTRMRFDNEEWTLQELFEGYTFKG